jgi:hypothetical protein
MANAGAARGRPVAMATQEIHYASMAQLVESSLMLSVIVRESMQLWLTTVSQAHFAWSVWMTNFHRHQQGGGHNWLNLIKIMVPAMIQAWSPTPTTRSLFSSALPSQYFLPDYLGSLCCHNGT